MDVTAKTSTTSKKTGLRERKKRASRHSIVMSALKLFEENGYDGTKIEEIADRAVVSVPTLYRYFDSKRDIALAAAEEEITSMRKAAVKLADSPLGDPVETFSKVILTWMEGVLSEDRGRIVRLLWKITYSEAIRAPSGDDYGQRYAKVVSDGLHELFVQLAEAAKQESKFRQSADSQDIAKTFMFLSHGIFRLCLLGQGLERKEAVALVRQQVKLVIDGFSTRDDSH